MNNTAGCLPTLTAMRLKPKRKFRISLNLLHSYEQHCIAYIKIVNRISSSKIGVIFDNHTYFWQLMFHFGVERVRFSEGETDKIKQEISEYLFVYPPLAHECVAYLDLLLIL